MLAQPADPCAHDLLAQSPPLPLGPYRKWAHPALDPRTMRDVERDDLIPLPAPRHRARSGVLDCITPDCWIEKRYAHADHPVAPIALGKRVAEHLIERRHVALPHRVGTVSVPRGL